MAGLDLSTLPQQLITGLLVGSIYALVALGYTMVYGVLKLINFAHGEVFMLGSYVALFVSWSMGYTPNNTLTGGSWAVLGLMLMASMAVCGVVGVLIERLAYRPMRNQPRIASLITAIGISLLLQYGGQLFLLNGTPQNIDPRVSPVDGNATFALSSQAAIDTTKLKSDIDKAQKEFTEYLAKSKESEFDIKTEEGKNLRTAKQSAERKLREAEDEASKGPKISVPKGQIVMLGIVVVLMAALTYLVMYTKTGRAMRAVSHDFDSAALMGINVNRIVAFTFVLGSALAGAGAMMAATFQPGTKIDTFFGVLPGTKAFVAAVLGGIGNIPGAVLGGILMGVAENLVVWTGYGGYKDAIAFVVLIAVLLFRPGGLLGSAKVEKV